MLSIVVPRSSFLRTALYIFKSLLSSIFAAVVEELGPGVALAPFMFGLLCAVLGFVLLFVFAPINNDQLLNFE